MDKKNYISDLELVDKFCETCLDFVHPVIFRDIEARGLYHIINFLPNNVNEAKAIARARLAKINRFFDDEEITGIANTIARIEFLKKELNKLNITDVHKTLPILNEMTELSLHVQNYFKK